MKPRNVYRGVSQAPKDSNSTDNRIGRLARIHRHYDKQSSRKRNKNVRSTTFRNYVYVLVIGSALGIIGLLGWIISGQMARKEVKTEVVSLNQETFAVPHPSSADCVQLYNKAMSAETAELLAPHVRLKSLNIEDAFRRLSETKAQDGKVLSVDWSGSVETNGLSMETILVTFESNKMRFAYLVSNNKDEWVLDLESYIRHTSKPWSVIAGSNSCDAIIRATVNYNSYYNGIFKDEQRWICFALASEDHQGSLWGYAKLKSAQHKALDEILRTSNPARTVIEISRDAGMDVGQYEIKRVLAQDWVESDDVFDAKFTSDTAASPTAVE